MKSLLSLIALSFCLVNSAQAADLTLAQVRYRLSQSGTVRVTVQTCRPSLGKFTAVKLTAAEGTMDLFSLDAVEKSGHRIRLPAPSHLNKGQSSAWIPVPLSNGACLSRFEMKVPGSSSPASTRVAFIGHWE
jgi:hypothetical protein